jgi:hypothetical protein
MFNDPISTAFMILAVILAVVAGLWFGSVLGDSAAGRDKDATASRGAGRFAKALQARPPASAVRRGSGSAAASRAPRTARAASADKNPGTAWYVPARS